MNLFNHLLESRTKEQLAKELAAAARENIELRDKVDELNHNLFWLDPLHTKENKDEHF